MKKIVGLTLLGVLALFLQTQVYAYKHFEKIDVVGHGKLLKDFTKNDYEDYYKEVSKRRFLGWRVHIVNNEMKVKYVSETLFSYYNDGKSAIEYIYQSDKKTVIQTDLSVTGNLSIKTNKNNAVFGDGLSASIKTEAKHSVKNETVEKIDLKIKVEPGTQLNLYLYGEGIVRNGVAQKYVFWFRNIKGGFETFDVTTHYQRLEISPI